MADTPTTATVDRLSLPKLALSVRQPWAWAIIQAGKQHENRSWGSWNHHLKKQRGPVCIHASTGMTRDEYEEAKRFMASRCGVTCPPPHELVRGGIIGTVEITDWVRTSHSPWFIGPGALVLERAAAVEPIPCSGALGFFEWKETGTLSSALKWMLPTQATSCLVEKFEAQGELL